MSQMLLLVISQLRSILNHTSYVICTTYFNPFPSYRNLIEDRLPGDRNLERCPIDLLRVEASTDRPNEAVKQSVVPCCRVPWKQLGVARVVTMESSNGR